MLDVHTLTEAASNETGVRLFVGVVTDKPEVAMEWITKLKSMVSGEPALKSTTLSSLQNTNSTVKNVISAALDDGANLDRDRYDAVFKILVNTSLSGPDIRISMQDLASMIGVQNGTIRTMNTKLSIRIGRVLQKRASELKHALPPFPVLKRNIDALLDTKWTKGNPEYRLTPSALPAVQEWLANRA